MQHGLSWKTAPDVSLLGGALCDLAARFLEICKNGVLPIKKLVEALIACCATSPCNLSGLPDATFCDQIGLACRTLMQKFRMLYDDEHTRTVALRKVVQL